MFLGNCLKSYFSVLENAGYLQSKTFNKKLVRIKLQTNKISYEMRQEFLG